MPARAAASRPIGGWIVGETTLVGQSVIDLAGEEAVNNVRGHTGMSPDSLLPAIREVSDRFLQEYRYKPDHNGMKGYAAAYILKAATEKVGSSTRGACGDYARPDPHGQGPPGHPARRQV